MIKAQPYVGQLHLCRFSTYIASTLLHLSSYIMLHDLMEQDISNNKM